MTKSTHFLSYAILCLFLTACNEPANTDDTSSTAVRTEVSNNNMSQVRADI
jgi:hypothetical protein